MTSSKEGKQFLVLVSVSPCTPARLETFIPGLKGLLEKISVAPIEQFFRAMSADHFGYLIRSKLVAQAILAAIETPQKESISLRNDIIPPFLTNQDKVAVLELGPTFATQQGFSRVSTWLQRH
jgi:hypothetical protein